MRKIILITLIILNICLPAQAFAAINPKSNFYFLQSWGEIIRLFFTFSKEGKIDYLIQLTDRRAEEISNNALDLDKEEMEKIIERYQDHFIEIKNISSEEIENKNQISQKVRRTNINQQQLLASAYQTIPEEKEELIVNAQKSSSENVFQVVKQIEGENAAENFLEQVQQIQQAQIVQKIEMAPMEGGALQAGEGGGGSKPSNPLNPLQEGKELK